MPTERVFSKNAAYQKFEVLKTNRNKRYKYRAFFVEGVRNINEAVRNGWKIQSFLYALDRPLSTWATGLLKAVPTERNFELSAALMDELSDREDTSELLAIAAMREDLNQSIAYAENPIIALFDRPSNRGNLGTLLRSCDAFGVDALILTGHAVDVYEPEVIRSSMGSFFKTPFLRLSDNADIDAYIAGMRLRFPGFKVVGTTAHRKASLFDVEMTGPVMLLIGNETEGLNQRLTECCDVLATIPMSPRASASSLNVSCAATVMFYEAARQRSAALINLQLSAHRDIIT